MTWKHLFHLTCAVFSMFSSRGKSLLWHLLIFYSQQAHWVQVLLLITCLQSHDGQQALSRFYTLSRRSCSRLSHFYTLSPCCNCGHLIFARSLVSAELRLSRFYMLSHESYHSSRPLTFAHSLVDLMELGLSHFHALSFPLSSNTLSLLHTLSSRHSPNDR